MAALDKAFPAMGFSTSRVFVLFFIFIILTRDNSRHLFSSLRSSNGHGLDSLVPSWRVALTGGDELDTPYSFLSFFQSSGAVGRVDRGEEQLVAIGTALKPGRAVGH